MIDQRYRTPVALSLMGAGIVVAILGYLGVSKETEVAFQLPFFASGAVGALLLFSAGAVLLLSTQLQDDTNRLEELEDAVRAMATELSRLADAGRDNGRYTEPSVTEPSATEPSATEPSATEPSATESSATTTRRAPRSRQPRATGSPSPAKRSRPASSSTS